MTTADVGVISATSPLPNWKALTTSSPATPANRAGGTMIGMATVANPELEGIKNESGMKSRKRMSTKRAPDVSATRPSAQLSTVSVILPLFMITVMPRAMPMMRATPSRSRAPSTNEPVRSDSESPPAMPTNGEEEKGGHLREPPPERGNRDAEVLPGDHAVDHGHEGEEEEPENDLVAPGEGSELRSGLLAGEEARLVLRLLRVHERLRRIGADLLGVAHHEDDADDQPDDEEEPEHKTLGDRDACKPGGDAGGERVDRRAEHPDARAEEEHGGADEGVVPAAIITGMIKG